MTKLKIKEIKVYLEDGTCIIVTNIKPEQVHTIE